MAAKKAKSGSKATSKSKASRKPKAASAASKTVKKAKKTRTAKKPAKKRAKKTQGLLDQIVKRSAQLIVSSGLLGEPKTSKKRAKTKKRARKS